MTDDAALLAAAAGGAFRRSFGAVLEIAPDGLAPFYVDGRAEPCCLAAEPPQGSPAACVWRASGETLLRIFHGGRVLESAYLSGRLKISGDMSVMARLVLESAP
ncbi:MAG: SCP2 sterol-binding domain-containing protein [Parvularculaceae bacterium]